MPPERPSLSLLLALPVEVKRLVCAQLCRHCCNLSPLELLFSPWDDLTLKALSETCTAFRDVAQPFLYHVPSIRSYASFLRTIRERPHLADSVKCLSCLSIRGDGNNHGLDNDVNRDGLFAVVKDMAAELQMYAPGDQPFDDEFSIVLAYHGAGSDEDKEKEEEEDYAPGRQMEVLYSLLAGVLIASLPCLEMFCIDAGDGDDDFYYSPQVYHHAKRRLARQGRLVSSRCEGPSMPTLHTIIVSQVVDPVFWQDQRDSHGNYNYGDVHLDPHEFLLSCASSLRQLVFCGIEAPYTWLEASADTGSSIWSTVPELRGIEFDRMRWGCCDEGQNIITHVVSEEELDVAYLRLRQMAEQCTKLSSFKISVEWHDLPIIANSFSPSRLLQSLMPTASRLEALTIYMDTIRPQPDPGVLLGADLPRFAQLQELSLDEMCFCQHWLYPAGAGVGSDVDVTQDGRQGATTSGVSSSDEHPEICKSSSCLVDILPLSVVSLNVRLRMRPRAIPDLVHLGSAAGAGEYPNLQHVTVETYLDFPDEDDERSYSHWVRRAPYSPGSIATAPQILSIRSKLAEAFRDSDIAVEVIPTRIRLTGPKTAVPML